MEVLLAIGDEAGCEKVARRILKMEPSHQRAGEIVRAIEGGLCQMEGIHGEVQIAGALSGAGNGVHMSRVGIVAESTSGKEGPSVGGLEKAANEGPDRGAKNRVCLGFAFDVLEPRPPELKRRRVLRFEEEEIETLKVRLPEPSWSALVLELQKVITRAGKGSQTSEEGLAEAPTAPPKETGVKSRGEGPVKESVAEKGRADQGEDAAGEGDGAHKGASSIEQSGQEKLVESGAGGSVLLDGVRTEVIGGERNVENGALVEGGKKAAKGLGAGKGKAGRLSSCPRTWTLQTPLVFEVAMKTYLGVAEEKLSGAGVSQQPLDGRKESERNSDIHENGPGSGKRDEGSELVSGIEQAAQQTAVEEREEVTAVEMAEARVEPVVASEEGQAVDCRAEPSETQEMKIQGLSSEAAGIVEAVALLETAAASDRGGASLSSQERQGAVDTSKEQGRAKTGGPLESTGEKSKASVEGAKEVKEGGKEQEAGAERGERRSTRALRERGSKTKGGKGEGKRKEYVKREEEPRATRSVWEVLGRFVTDGGGSADAGSGERERHGLGSVNGGKNGLDSDNKRDKNQPDFGMKVDESEATDGHVAAPADDTCLSGSAGLEEFLFSVSKNSGALHVEECLLEELARKADVGLGTAAVEALLSVEALLASWGLERTSQCSLWLAQLYLDRAEKGGNGETPEGLRERVESAVTAANRCLCGVVEWWAVRHAELQGGLQADEVNPQKGAESGEEEFEIQAAATSGGGNTGVTAVERGVNALDAAFWAKFQWAASRLAFVEGNKARGVECLDKCARLMEAIGSLQPSTPIHTASLATESKSVSGLPSPMDLDPVDPALSDKPLQKVEEEETPPLGEEMTPHDGRRGSNEVLQLGCDLRARTLSLSDVRSKLQEIEMDELLTRSAAELREAGKFEALVALLAPIVLPGWEAPSDVISSPADVTSPHADVGNEGRSSGATAAETGVVLEEARHRPVLDTQRRLEGLRALLHACVDAEPRYLSTELWARTEVLEVLVRASGWLARSKEALLEFDVEGLFGGGQETPGVLGGGTVQERVERMQRVGRLIGAELKAIGRCVQDLRGAAEREPCKVGMRLFA
jgi:hypothetical protein